MMHLSFQLSVLAIVVMLSTACEASISFGGDDIEGSGDVVTEHFDLGSFDRIDVGSTFEADITIGDDTAIVIETDDNVVEHLDVRVRDGELRLRLDDVNLRNATLRATIVTPGLEALDANGASAVEVGDLDSDDFDLDVSGASNVRIARLVTGELRFDASGASTVAIADLDATRAGVEISGTSRVTAKGAVADLDLEVNGASDVDMDDLQADEAQVDIDGASNVDLRDAQVVRGQVDGASRLSVDGDAGTDVSVSGASSLERS